MIDIILYSQPAQRVRRLDLTAPTRTMGARKLLREGILMKAKSGRRLRAFLCSDILVLTDESAKTLYRMVSLSILQRYAPYGSFCSLYHCLRLKSERRLAAEVRFQPSEGLALFIKNVQMTLPFNLSWRIREAAIRSISGQTLLETVSSGCKPSRKPVATAERQTNLLHSADSYVLRR